MRRAVAVAGLALSALGCTPRDRSAAPPSTTVAPSTASAPAPSTARAAPARPEFRSVPVADDVIRVPCVAVGVDDRPIVAFAVRGGKELRVLRSNGDALTQAAPPVASATGCRALHATKTGLSLLVHTPSSFLWGLDLVTIDAAGRAARRQIEPSNVTPGSAHARFDGDRTSVVWTTQPLKPTIHFELSRWSTGDAAPTKLSTSIENAAGFLGDAEHVLAPYDAHAALGVFDAKGAMTPFAAPITSVDYDTLDAADGVDVVARMGRRMVHVHVAAGRASAPRTVADAEEWALYPHLVRGARGVDVVYYSETARELRRRRLGAEGFGPPDTITSFDASDGFAVATDAAGRLVVAAVDAAFRLALLVEQR